MQLWNAKPLLQLLYSWWLVEHLLPFRRQGSCKQSNKNPVLTRTVRSGEALMCCKTVTAAKFLDDPGFVILLIAFTSFWRSGPAIRFQLLREFREK